MKHFLYVTVLFLCTASMLDLHAQFDKNKYNLRTKKGVQQQQLSNKIAEAQRKIYNVSFDMAKVDASYSQLTATSNRDNEREEAQHLCPVTYKASPYSSNVRVQVNFGVSVLNGMPGGNTSRVCQRAHYVNFGVRIQGQNEDNDFEESVILSRSRRHNMNEIISETGRNVFVQEFEVTPGETLTITPFIKCVSKIESSSSNSSAQNTTTLTGTIQAIEVDGFF